MKSAARSAVTFRDGRLDFGFIFEDLSCVLPATAGQTGLCGTLPAIRRKAAYIPVAETQRHVTVLDRGRHECPIESYER